MSSILSQKIHAFIRGILYKKPLSFDKSLNVLAEQLQVNKPRMIARFGSVEIKAILYPKMPWPLRMLLKKRIFTTMQINAGFFPVTEKSINKFSKLMLQNMKLLDVLGSWRMEERFLLKNFKLAKLVPLSQLEPYFQNNPWSEVLENKNVLVIHPFNKTIESQYNNKREVLFKDPRVLPKFKSLQTIKAVQTIAGNESEFSSWFDALEFMKREIETKDFDIAIIGCGAYGFPLAAHVKRIGKKAIHLGGATQILFGIKGKRWEQNEKFKHIINEHFIFPSNDDKPKNNKQVEDGCYW